MNSDEVKASAVGAVAEVLAQPALQPGQEGWWKVYGARATDIQDGDVVAGSGWMEEIVATNLRPEDYLGTWVRTATGDEFRIGALARITVVRKGTAATLADSI